MVDCAFQNFLGINIQMVGRLVQDQKIGIREHQLGKGNTSAFTAAEFGNLFENIILRKKKCGKDIADLCIGHSRVIILQLFKDRFFSVEYLMCLIVVADVYICSEPDGTAIGIYQIVDDLQDRRFAGAVIANDGNTFPAL